MQLKINDLEEDREALIAERDELNNIVSEMEEELIELRTNNQQQQLYGDEEEEEIEVIHEEANETASNY